MARTIEIGDSITVGALAEKLSLPATNLIAELFKNGIMATINEKIDIDTAQILVGELDLDVEVVGAVEPAEDDSAPTKRTRTVSDSADSRPPVVAVMGHVDHGKTSLLDAIRQEDVAAGEAGGITQHISAYQVTHNDRLLTFLDTPGHEAFAALREHGAHLTDVAVIVVAADDGIKPQTLEAIRFARKAGVQIVVAITKMDKPEANPDLVRQQLAEQQLMPEEWGGTTVMVPVSSKTKDGIDKLLDMILLLTDVEELKADVDVPGEGLVIESHMEQGRGPIAVALVEQGTLKQGSFVVAGGTYAKVRVLETTAGNTIKSAGPSTPVIIVGFKALPQFGDSFVVVANEKEARSKSAEFVQKNNEAGSHVGMTSRDLIRLINQKTDQQELNLIIKADVQGSLTSVIDSIKTLDTDEVAVRVVGSGVGTITENDIRMASTSNAIIYGFHVDLPQNIKRLASRDKVTVRMYKVIYELIDDTRQAMSDRLVPEEVITEAGRLVVRGVFKTTKTDAICGGEVTKGKLVYPAYANVFRDDKQLAEGLVITNLKHGPTDTKEVLEGEMCGMSLATTTRLDLQEGDRVEVYTSEIRERTL